jgi:hypothetical protein
MRAPAVLRCRCADLGGEAVGLVDPSVRALPRGTPISISTMSSQLACLGCSGPQDPASFGGLGGLVEGVGRADRQIILHDANTLGVGTMYVDERVHALGVIFGGLGEASQPERGHHRQSKRQERGKGGMD